VLAHEPGGASQSAAVSQAAFIFSGTESAIEVKIKTNSPSKKKDRKNLRRFIYNLF